MIGALKAVRIFSGFLLLMSFSVVCRYAFTETSVDGFSLLVCGALTACGATLLTYKYMR